MARETSSKPWRKYAAYPGQPEFLPGARLRASTWQDLRQIVRPVRPAIRIDLTLAAGWGLAQRQPGGDRRKDVAPVECRADRGQLEARARAGQTQAMDRAGTGTGHDRRE